MPKFDVIRKYWMPFSPKLGVASYILDVYIHTYYIYKCYVYDNNRLKPTKKYDHLPILTILIREPPLDPKIKATQIFIKYMHDLVL